MDEGSHVGERGGTAGENGAVQAPAWGFTNSTSIEQLGKYYNKNQMTILGPGGGWRTRMFLLPSLR